MRMLKTLSPEQIVNGVVYRIQTRTWAALCAVEGPWRDGRKEFFIVSTPDGDFDIEWRNARWDAGPSIGLVNIKHP